MSSTDPEKFKLYLFSELDQFWDRKTRTGNTDISAVDGKK